MSWTEDRIATLTKLWEGGATASRIAEELGGVSRNAVIGKAHRLGLKARPSPVKPSDKKGEQAAAAVPATAPDDVIIQTPPAPSRRASPPPPTTIKRRCCCAIFLKTGTYSFIVCFSRDGIRIEPPSEMTTFFIALVFVPDTHRVVEYVLLP